jgi:hypothetical protein
MLWVDGVVLGSVLSFGGIPISGYSMESSPTPTLYNTFRCTLHCCVPRLVTRAYCGLLLIGRCLF